MIKRFLLELIAFLSLQLALSVLELRYKMVGESNGRRCYSDARRLSGHHGMVDGLELSDTL